MAFVDPNFDDSKYVKVNERIAEFREKFPDGLMTTIRTTDEFGVSFRTVVCRTKEEAELYGKTNIAAATGHSYLKDSKYSEKAEEYAETVSVGRALANLGLRVENAIASQEEMDQVLSKKKTSSNAAAEESDDDEDLDDEDEELDEDDESDEDDEDGEDEEPKLKSSRPFSRGRSSRFGGGK